mgnify:CR=1 FL=1
MSQADGNWLGYLLAPSARRPGHEVLDRRFMPIAESVGSGPYHLKVGLYSLADRSRYEVDAFAAEPTGDRALETWSGTLSQ